MQNRVLDNADDRFLFEVIIQCGCAIKGIKGIHINDTQSCLLGGMFLDFLKAGGCTASSTCSGHYLRFWRIAHQLVGVPLHAPLTQKTLSVCKCARSIRECLFVSYL